VNHYIDVDVQPDPDFPATQLMSALYGRLHRALAGEGTTEVGVSFPQMFERLGSNPRHQEHLLGCCMRLHGTSAALATLLASDWLKGMRDHVDMTPMHPVPAQATHRKVYRVQTKSSPERLRRRFMRRHNVSEQEARARIPDDMAPRYASWPSVDLRSSSTGQSFKLFIAHGPEQPEPEAGSFSAYGLSQGSTIPWF